jgi:ATP/maltotriose-dependent transcriptional regulator MalT
MTTHADLTEVSDRRIVADWALGEWADRLLEQAGLGVTIVDRHGTVMYYNKWASEHLDRQPAYLGHSVYERHRRVLTAALPSPGVAATAPNQACTLIEGLTAKELEVLGLMTTRLSRREIGQRLFVSLNTVKTHQRALYRKLGVQDRNTAVSRARQLGLL